MNQVRIHGAEYSLYNVFSHEFLFTIPYYQRPYSWTMENAGKLFDDLVGFMENEKDKSLDEMSPYFLGSLVLIKGPGPESIVLDGQQRLITLTILLSALRERVPNLREELTQHLYEKENKIMGTPNRYRLTPRKQDIDFFKKYIQDEKGISSLPNIGEIKILETQRNIRDNALLFLEKLETLSGIDLELFVKILINQCFVVIVTTPDFASAYQIFSILNDRGLNLSLTDIMKADLIGEMTFENQEKYADKWVNAEELLGREMFQDLFSHIRMIYRRTKSKETVLKELRDYVRPDLQKDNPMEFIEEVILNNAAAFYMIKKGEFKSKTKADHVNSLFRWLNLINNFDWIPPAMVYLNKYNNDPEKLIRFFLDLERLASGLVILRASNNDRIERYGSLLKSIENGENLSALNSPLQLNPQESQKILETLNGDLYPIRLSLSYILRRLDYAISEEKADHTDSIITVEHVLPQNPKSGSVWEKWFPTKELLEKYTYSLGNLVLLSRSKNSKAKNYDFETKKKKYFFSDERTTTFALTTMVMNENEWTPDVIDRRQKELIEVSKKLWRL